MRRFLVFIAALTFVFSLNAQDLKILFVGNSYTFTNDLPNLLTELAKTNDKRISYKDMTIGGARFMTHCKNAQLIEEIKSGRYDIMVLQGQSQEVAFPYEQFMEEVYPYAHQLDSLFKEYNPQARVIYFMTWGYRYGDQANCPFYSPFCSYETMSQELCKNYSLMASDFQSEVSPIGRAWLYLYEKDSLSFDLHSSDYSHPNLKGSYFSACVLYTTVFKTAVMSGFYSSLTDAEAVSFQQTANELFLNNQFTDCEFVSSLSELRDDDINIRYNQLQSLLEVNSKEYKGNIQLEIYNLNGVKVKQFTTKTTNQLIVNLNDLTDGYYIAKVRLGKVTRSYNFVKQ